jgi:hypothetical protein
MVVGAPAFSGPSAVDTALAVMTGDSVKVPEDAPVPAALRQIIERAAAKRPEDRYQSAQAFLAALDAFYTALFVERPKPPAHTGTPVASATAAPSAASISAMRRAIEAAEGARAAGDDEGALQQTIQIDMRELEAARPPERASETRMTEVQPAAGEQVDRRAATTALDARALETMTIATAAAQAPASARSSTPSIAGAPPVLVVLQVATLVLLVVLLVAEWV